MSIIIAVCFIFYKIFLQKETFFRLNRWVLMTFILFAFVLPFVSVPAKWSLRNTVVKAVQSPILNKETQTPVKEIPSNVITTTPVNNNPSVASTQPGETVSWTRWVYYLYISGLIIFGVNLLFQFVTLLIQCYKSPVVKDGIYKIIEVSGNKAPCSFGNYIFINPEKYDWETYSQILLHEKIHCHQKHSIDILLSEILLVVQWFNPFAWLYRKQVETNLEFLTDASMIDKNAVEISGYQMNLLKVAAPHLPLGITTNYNQSLLKKRIAMMNEKKSSMHTAWKYFFLLPLLTFIVCALNQPIAVAQETAEKNKDTEKHSDYDGDRIETEGSWFATIKGDKISFDFKSGKDGHNWSNNTTFKKSDFTSLPGSEKADFKLTRDAGTINFNGKFDGDLGYGHYKFVADESYKSYLGQQGIKDVKEMDMFGFFMVNVSKDYVAMVKRNGYSDISKDYLIAMCALNVDERYIRFWKSLGYDNPQPENLISFKALGIDSAYVGDIRDAGYKNMNMDKLTAFKAQGVNGDYIRKVKKARADKGESQPTPDDIITFKAMNIDEAYVKSLSDVGYGNIPNEQLVSMKSLGIDGSFIKGFQAIGYKDLTPDALISFKSLSITPDFIKGFDAIGYKDIDDGKIMSMKSLGVKPEFVKGFKDLGFKNITLDEVASVKSMGITPAYIASMRKKGFDSNDINKYIELKSSFHDVQ
ncbi:MAG: M56 family metallopeptidase [Chitinophagaceae bacterium]